MIDNIKKQTISQLDALKKEWKKIFYVEWVFDLFHEWHIAFLTYLRNKITSMYWKTFAIVVAVESNQKTKKKKWKNRPIDDEFVRMKNVQNTNLVDVVYINNNDVRYLKQDLKELSVDYLVFPEEYIKNLKLFLVVKNKLRKNWVKLLLSRHKQYDKYWVSKNLSLIHTTSILKSWLFWKIITKFRHLSYLTKETLFLLLKD